MKSTLKSTPNKRDMGQKKRDYSALDRPIEERYS